MGGAADLYSVVAGLRDVMGTVPYEVQAVAMYLGSARQGLAGQPVVAVPALQLKLRQLDHESADRISIALDVDNCLPGTWPSARFPCDYRPMHNIGDTAPVDRDCSLAPRVVHNAAPSKSARLFYDTA